MNGLKRKSRRVDFSSVCRHWSTCAMSSDKAEQRGRRMEAPPTTTHSALLRADLSWPPRPPSAAHRPHWLGLNRFGLQGSFSFSFYDREREEPLLHCNMLLFYNAVILKGSELQRCFSCRHTMQKTDRSPRLTPVIVAAFLPGRSSLHFSCTAACWQKW